MLVCAGRPRASFAIAGLLLLLGVCHNSSVATGAPDGSADIIGRDDSPQAFRFAGCRAFEPAEIAGALQASLDVQVASIPGAPVEPYLRVVRNAVTAGYLKAGYLKVKVSVARDPESGSVVVTVEEGSRFTCGSIRVVGAKALPVERLIEKLTRDQLPTLFPYDFNAQGGAFRLRTDLQPKDPEYPAWRRGEPVAGDEKSVQTLREDIRRSCCELGYFEAWTEALTTTDAPQATLEITIRSEGPRAVVNAVDVLGARKNSPERIAEYLGLDVGAPLDLDQLRQAQQKLWDAARFTQHTIYAEPRRDDPSRMRVRIELREYDQAPPLDEPFSPAEQAALKFCQWATGIRDREEEIAASFNVPFGQVDFALGHRQGLAARVKVTPTDNSPELGLLATPSEVALSAAADARVFRIGVPPVNLHADLIMGPDPNPKEGKEWVLGVQAGINNRPRPGAPPFELRPALAPVAFVQLVHQSGYQFDVRNGVLTGSGPEIKRLAVNATTGRLLELDATSADGDRRAIVSLRKGAVEELAASMQAGTRNTYDPAAPAGSFLRFGVRQAMHLAGAARSEPLSKARRDAAAAATDKLLGGDALAPLEPLARSLAAALGDQKFFIPLPPLSDPRGAPAYATGPALRAMDDLFPRASCPWTLARLALLVPAGEYRGAQEEVERLMGSDDVGPLGYLAAAELLARVNPAMAPPFAQRGLQRLEVEWFEKDVDQLLREGFPPAEVLGRLAANLRGLTPAEVMALSAELPPEVGERLRRLADGLRLRPDAPPQELLRSALRDGWSRGLRQVVEARLQALKTAPPAQP